MKGQHAVALLCEVMMVSRSGYYRWRERRPTSRERDDARLAAQIAAAHSRSRQNYGAPRIVEELREAGTPISKRRCARLMRARGLRGRKSTVAAPARPIAAMPILRRKTFSPRRRRLPDPTRHG